MPMPQIKTDIKDRWEGSSSSGGSKKCT